MISLSCERNRVETAETMQEKTSITNMVIQAIWKIFRLRMIPSSFWL